MTAAPLRLMVREHDPSAPARPTSTIRPSRTAIADATEFSLSIVRKWPLTILRSREPSHTDDGPFAAPTVLPNSVPPAAAIVAPVAAVLMNLRREKLPPLLL